MEREEEEEEVKKTADVKYDEFRRECGHLLDPALSAEFSLMESLGLPTKLINSLGDMESEVRGSGPAPALTVPWPGGRGRGGEGGGGGGGGNRGREEGAEEGERRKLDLQKMEGQMRREVHLQKVYGGYAMFTVPTILSLLLPESAAESSFQYQQHVDHLQTVYQEPHYCIDWSAVREGTEAGLPGKWVSLSLPPKHLSIVTLPPSQTSLPSSEGSPPELTPEDETAALLRALKVKAAAFSDSDWLAHWNSHAPSLLARGWLSLHPLISLASVERATGLRFLVAAAGETGETGEEVMVEVVRATGALDISSDNESHDSLLAPPTDDEIQRLWGKVYNDHYWYCYWKWVEGKSDQNCGREGGCEEGEGEGCEGNENGSGGCGEDSEEEGPGEEGGGELKEGSEIEGDPVEDKREEEGGGGGKKPKSARLHSDREWLPPEVYQQRV